MKLVATDSEGNMVEEIVSVTLLRPVAISRLDVSAEMISADSPVNISYGVEWASFVSFEILHPSGNHLVHDNLLISGPAPDASSGGSFTLTVDDVTQNGSLTHAGDTVTIRMTASNDDGSVTREFTLKLPSP